VHQTPALSRREKRSFFQGDKGSTNIAKGILSDKALQSTPEDERREGSKGLTVTWMLLQPRGVDMMVME
jgi:hypothetical protein